MLLNNKAMVLIIYASNDISLLFLTYVAELSYCMHAGTIEHIFL